MRSIALLFCLFGTSVLCCTSRNELTQQEYIEFINDPSNGLSQKKEANGIETELIYQPTDLLVSRELNDEPLAGSRIDSLKKKYSPYHYFVLKLSRGDREALQSLPQGQFSEMVQTLSFRMTNYVSLTTSSQDTIPISDAVLDRTYGLTQATSVLFVFPVEKSKNTDWVQFNLNEFGMGLGNQRFRFKTKDLENTPSLIFNTH